MDNQGTSSPQHILTGQTERIASVSPAASVRILSKILVAGTFILIFAGALITGNKAAMADSTWPLFLGNWYPKYFQGGLRFTETHRLIVMAIGFITLLLAIVIQFKEKRRFMKKLGWAAFGLVIIQALFGGLVIKSIRHPAASMAHATIAQAFFCTTIAIAVLSSRTWFREFSAPAILRPENRGYVATMKFAVLVICFQVIMGTGVRHSNDATDMFLPYLMAHIGGAFAVIVTIIWFNLRTWQVYSDVPSLRHTAVWAAALVAYQILFGLLSIMANRARLNAGIPELHHVIVSTGHLLGGTTLLALMFGSLIRTCRLLDRSSPTHITGQAYQSREVNA